MSNFPLYDSLSKNLELVDEISIKDQDKFMKLIKNFDTNGYELIYALIRVYQLENSDDKSTFKLPYGGKFLKNEMKFDFTELPPDLKKILFNFTIMHTKTMKEEII
jgi:hypothetical protein